MNKSNLIRYAAVAVGAVVLTGNLVSAALLVAAVVAYRYADDV